MCILQNNSRAFQPCQFHVGRTVINQSAAVVPKALFAFLVFVFVKELIFCQTSHQHYVSQIPRIPHESTCILQNCQLTLINCTHVCAVYLKFLCQLFHSFKLLLIQDRFHCFQVLRRDKNKDYYTNKISVQRRKCQTQLWIKIVTT